jgi:hypothetical protein
MISAPYDAALLQEAMDRCAFYHEALSGSAKKAIFGL